MHVNAQILRVDSVHGNVDVLPDFPGGSNEMMSFLSKSINYPLQAKENGWVGKVYLKFIVKDDGVIDSITVLKSSGYKILDNEAIRVINKMPKWKPATRNFKPIKCYFNLPIKFSLSEGIVSENQLNNREYNLTAKANLLFYDAYNNLIKSNNTRYNSLPSFEGSSEKLSNYLRSNNKLLNNTIKEKKCNFSVIKITIEPTGLISKSEIAFSSGSVPQDNEAIRLVSNMPKWKPAIKDNEPVKTYCKIAVLFTTEINDIDISNGLTEQQRDYNFRYYYNLGIDDFRANEYESASSYFNHSLLYDANNIDALYNLSISGIKLNKMEYSCEILKRIQMLGKPDADELIKKYCSN